MRKIGKEILAGKIVETEAYIGPFDRASHAYGGKVTPRNKVEYLIGGHVYIYLIYGMYWQLNVITEQLGKPECVLIRALELDTDSFHLANGPGKLCRFLKLDKSFYAEDLTSSSCLWLEDRGVKIVSSQIKSSPRVGIDYAGPIWSKKPWRFYVSNSPAVSRR